MLHVRRAAPRDTPGHHNGHTNRILSLMVFKCVLEPDVFNPGRFLLGLVIIPLLPPAQSNLLRGCEEHKRIRIEDFVPATVLGNRHRDLFATQEILEIAPGHKLFANSANRRQLFMQVAKADRQATTELYIYMCIYILLCVYAYVCV